MVDGEARLFLSCPDADALVDKLWPWIEALDWPREIHVVKRAGDMYDEDAPEEVVELD